MNRDEFLLLMISHLEEMKNEEESNEQVVKSSHMQISTILNKLKFNDPLLDDQQIRRLSEFFMLFGTPNYDDGEDFKITPLFLENMRYIRMAPSYSNHQNSGQLFEAVYLYLPLSFLKYEKDRLIQLFDCSNDDEITMNSLFHRIFTQLDVTLPSIFAANRSIPLTEPTLNLLLQTLSHIVHLLIPSDSFSINETTTTTIAMKDYYSQSLRSTLSQPTTEITPENQHVLNKSINLFSSLLFLLRDLCLLKDEFATRVLPLLFQQVLIPLLEIPSNQLQSIGYIVGAGIIFQLQLSTLFLISDFCFAFLPEKSEKLHREARKILSSSLCSNITTIVSCTEAILNSFALEQQSTNDYSSDKIIQQVLESVISIISMTATSTEQIRPSSTIPPVDMSEVFLSSRLFPLLSSLFLKNFHDPTEDCPFYLKLNTNIKQQLLWALASISHLTDSSLSIYIHKIFLPIIIRLENQKELSLLSSSRIEMSSSLLIPIIGILMGSIKSKQNHTVIKSFEKSLTTFMKKQGDTSELMICSTPLTEIIQIILPILVNDMMERSQQLHLHFSSLLNENNNSKERGEGERERGERREGRQDEEQGDHNEEFRQHQKSSKEFTSLITQYCKLIQLLIVTLTKQKMTTTSLLPPEYLSISNIVISAMNEIIRQMNSSLQVVSEMEEQMCVENNNNIPVEKESEKESERKRDEEDAKHTTVKEIKRVMYQFSKLVKSYSNQLINNNSKTD